MDPKPFKEIPLADGLPILGNAIKLTSKAFHRNLYEIAGELGGIYRITAPLKVIVVVSDPTLLQEITNEDNVDYIKPADLYQTFAQLCSTPTPTHGLHKHYTFPMLATHNLQQWSAIRQGFTKAFAPDAVGQYLPTLVKETSVVLDQTGDTGKDDVFDILEYVGRMALSATGKIMFDYDFDCTDLKKPPIVWQALITARKGGVDKARSPIIKLCYGLCPFLPTPQNWQENLDLVLKTYEDVYENIRSGAPATFPVGKAGSTIKESFYTTPDYEDGTQPMKKEDAIATIGNLVIAGSMPAATAAAYTLALISCSPSVQQKVQAELDSIGLSKRPFEASDAGQLKYTNMVIKEAMRVNPTVPQVIRQTANNVVLGGYQIPKDTVLMMSMGGCHTSPHNYTREAEFWPERWELTPQQAAAQSDPHYPKASPIGNVDNLMGSHVPFSTGPRACLGQHWARLSILALVSSICSRFTLTAPDDLTPKKLADDETFAINAFPVHPIMITFTPRN